MPRVRQENRHSAIVLLVTALVLSLFGSGLLNILASGNQLISTYIVDGVAFVILFWLGLDLVFRPKTSLPAWGVALFVVSVVYLGLSVASPESFSDIFLGFRSEVLYAFIGFACYRFVRGPRDRDDILRIVCNVGTCLAAFGVIQYFARGILPDFLLKPKDAEVFGYYGTDIVRSNGLVGNTIVFAHLLLLVFALQMARVTTKLSAWTVISPAVTAGAIVLSFSRSAILGAALVFAVSVIYWVRKGGASKLLITLAALAMGASCVVVGLYTSGGTQHDTGEPIADFIVGDLFGSTNASVQGSNQGHANDIAIGVDAFLSNPLTGVGIHTHHQGSAYSRNHEVITDGAFWQVLAEGGVMLSGAYIAVFVLLLRNLVRVYRNSREVRPYVLGFMIYFVYMVCWASFVNSSLFGKPVFVVTWIVAGVLCKGLVRHEPSERSAAKAMKSIGTGGI
jgi:hypothetical protein